MSAARVIQFPGTVRSRREISGPSRRLIIGGEEREPSPGSSAWPWIIFSGGKGEGMRTRWVSGAEVLEELDMVAGELVQLMREGKLCPVDEFTLEDRTKEADPCLYCEGADPLHDVNFPGYGKCKINSRIECSEWGAKTRIDRVLSAKFRVSDIQACARKNRLHTKSATDALHGFHKRISEMHDTRTYVRTEPCRPPEDYGMPLDAVVQAARVEAKTQKEPTPKEIVTQMKAREAEPAEIIAELEKRWPHLHKYRVGAYAKELDPDNPKTRKQAEKHYRDYKPRS